MSVKKEKEKEKIKEKEKREREKDKDKAVAPVRVQSAPLPSPSSAPLSPTLPQAASSPLMKREKEREKEKDKSKKDGLPPLVEAAQPLEDEPPPRPIGTVSFLPLPSIFYSHNKLSNSFRFSTTFMLEIPIRFPGSRDSSL